ncbi:MAG: histidine phosphatase family protein [Methylocystis sp.]
MATRLDLLCAAATPGLRAGIFPVAGEPLDAKGRASLTSLAGRPKGQSTILVSPGLSALQTAEGLGLQAAPEPALRDCDFGRWAGRALSEIEVEERDALALWLSDPRSAPHGGESLVDVLERVGAWMDALPRDSAVLAIAPAALLRAAIVHALAAGSRALLSLEVSPLARARLARARTAWRFSSLIPAA